MRFLEELAGNIRDARVAKGWTQRQLAQKVGVTSSAVNQYERAKRTPNLKTMSIMSHALDVTLDELVPYATHEIIMDPRQTSLYDLIGE